MLLRLAPMLLTFVFLLCVSAICVDAGDSHLHVRSDSSYGNPPHRVRFKASVSSPAIDFRQYKLQSWYEDRENKTSLEDDGRTIRMVGNAAKMIEVNYQITPATLLEFDFRCDVQGEVHGIGLANDTKLDITAASRIFVLYGTEGWGAANTTYRHYDPHSDRQRWMRFRLPVGQTYQGRFKYLVFMNDHDVASPNADSRFRNVTLSEAGIPVRDHIIRWDFGDGKSVTGKWDVEHTFQTAGQFVVTTAVTDKRGVTRKHTANIVVKQPSHVRRRLFLDDRDIERIQGARRIANRALKHPDNPVIVGDKPWDAYRPQVYGTVLFDDRQKRFRMWYLAWGSHVLSPAPEPIVDGIKRIGHTSKVGYAESQDGYQWSKPPLGIVDYNGSKKNGLVNIGRDNPEGVSIVYQPDDPNPARRYKAIYWEHKVAPKGEPIGREILDQDPRPDGMWVSFSKHGLHWQDYKHNPVISQGSDTGQCVLYDPKLKKYVLYSRLGVGRRISRTTSDDFLKWSKPKLVFAADQRDPPGTQVYGSGFCIYEDHYIGLPWMFYQALNQKIDVQLLHSRDGISWHRTAGRERIIPNGPEGAWDSGIIFTACQPVVTDDRIFIYYFGIQGDHHGHPERDWEESQKYYRGGIGVATLRRDGWVSLDLPYTGGSVITKPLTVPAPGQGDTTPRLILNTNAYTGDVRVTVLDENNGPVRGFEESNNLHGDFLRTEVTWPSGQTLAKLTGRKVKLKIHGRLAKLYSYWFE